MSLERVLAVVVAGQSVLTRPFMPPGALHWTLANHNSWHVRDTDGRPRISALEACRHGSRGVGHEFERVIARTTTEKPRHQAPM